MLCWAAKRSSSWALIVTTGSPVSATRRTMLRLMSTESGEGSAPVRDRVAAARDRAAHRFAGLPYRLNADIPAGDLRRRWLPDPGGAGLLRDLDRASVNLRGPDRVLRMAWSVADLAGRSRPGRDDIAMACSLRGASAGWAP